MGYNYDIEDNNLNSPIRRTLKSKWYKISWNNIKKWLQKKSKGQTFWDIYFRMFLESFIGIVLMSIIEVKSDNSENKVSNVIAWIIIAIYSSFFVSTYVFWLIESIQRNKLKQNIQNLQEVGPINIQDNEESKEQIEEFQQMSS